MAWGQLWRMPGPAELSGALARHGLEQHDLTGMSPGIASPALIRLKADI
jgi:hypothetical protein